MTNFENIRATKDGMSAFIAKVAYGMFDPWAELFARKFCDNCKTTHVTYQRIEDTDGNVLVQFPSGAKSKEDDLHACDYSDGVCPYGDDITWWLNQECTE
jgi:hypothetical protein